MIRVVTAPAVYPVTLAEARLWCKAFDDITADDSILTILIAAMTGYAEHRTGRAYVERTLELNLTGFKSCIELPWPPLIGVDSVTYVNTSEQIATVSSAEYEVDAVSEPGRLRPLATKSWPSVGTLFNPVRIQYRAGYVPAASPTDLTDNSYLPGHLRIWMQARIATLYGNREQIIDGRDVEIPRDFADGLLDSLVVGTRFF